MRHSAVTIVCRGEREAHVRALLLQGLAANGLKLVELEGASIEDRDRVEVAAEIDAEKISDVAVEQLVGRLSLEPPARWRLTPNCE